MECEYEYQSYIFEKRSAEYANGRLLLKSAVSSDWFRILDEYIEEYSEPTQHELSQFNPASTFPSVQIHLMTWKVQSASTMESLGDYRRRMGDGVETTSPVRARYHFRGIVTDSGSRHLSRKETLRFLY